MRCGVQENDSGVEFNSGVEANVVDEIDSGVVRLG